MAPERTEPELVPGTDADRALVANLLQLYLHDHSQYAQVEPDASGRFEFPWLDDYFGRPGRECWVIRADGRPVGFALTRDGVPGDEDAWHLAEFFVLRAHRRRGLGRRAARLVLQRHPGWWTLSYLANNTPAAGLWPALAAELSGGRVRRVEQAQTQPAAPAPRYRLRFEVPAP
ncbi:GNAT family N-acetyltransferase [Kitasatospora sp. LaBMicrA B282]|uniref:GNAT family N-acetyltransferase n=1 Tax=Kitasatospora sp. LaBMicrA B282 TaxID=3420949 RepID=UPI003D0DA31B